MPTLHIGRRSAFSFAAVLTVALSSESLCGQTGVNVTTWHNDPGRTGQNTSEMTLTPSNVNESNFGLLCKIPLSSNPQQDQIYTQPLVVANSGGMTVYVATMQDKVYAFNVPSAWTSQACALLQSTAPVNLLDQNHLAGQYPADACFVGGGNPQADDCSLRALCPSVGVLGTPVIDTTSNTIYLVTETQDTDTGTQGVRCLHKSAPNFWYHYLHALDLTTLAEKNSGPKLIAPSGGKNPFVSVQLLQRPGLLFLPPGTSPTSPTVYAAFSMMDGVYPNPSGWALAYDGGNLGLGGFPLVFDTTPNVTANTPAGGGIWQGGAGLAAGVDANQNNYIYLSTADGVFDASKSSYGDTFLKLNTELQFSDYFTPSDAFYRWDGSCTTDGKGHDLDFGSGGVTLIPDGIPTTGAHLAVKGDKEGGIWVIDRTDPGHQGAPCSPGCGHCTNNTNVQTMWTPQGYYHNSPAYWSDATHQYLYFAGSLSGQGQPVPLTQYPLCPNANAPICSTGSIASTVRFNYGATPSVSSSGPTNGIVWAIDAVNGYASEGGQPGVLHAFNASNVAAVELYNSGQCGTADLPGAATKYSVPTVANGYVFIGTVTDFDIYGPLLQARQCQ